MFSPDGDRQGGIVDPFGHIWWLSQRLEHEPLFLKSRYAAQSGFRFSA